MSLTEIDSRDVRARGLLPPLAYPYKKAPLRERGQISKRVEGELIM